MGAPSGLTVHSLTRALSIKGEVQVLFRDVSFEAPEGTALGLTGPSGSGKTSILRVVLGLDALSDGQVLWNGKNLLAEDPVRWRSVAVGVLQTPSPLEETPLLAVKRVLRHRVPESDRETPDVASVVAVAETLLLPERTWDQSFGKLSGGEICRMHLALALALNPRLLLLDEPTAGLDRHAARAVSDALARFLGDGATLLVASHDELFLAQTCPELLVLYEGTIDGRGRTRELLPAADALIREEESR